MAPLLSGLTIVGPGAYPEDGRITYDNDIQVISDYLTNLSGSSIPGGSNNDVQFNNAGVFGGTNLLQFNTGLSELSLGADCQFVLGNDTDIITGNNNLILLGLMNSIVFGSGSYIADEFSIESIDPNSRQLFGASGTTALTYSNSINPTISTDIVSLGYANANYFEKKYKFNYLTGSSLTASTGDFSGNSIVILTDPGSISFTLPAISGATIGFPIIIKAPNSSGTLTIYAHAGDLIDNTTSVSISSGMPPNPSIKVVTDATYWYVIP